MPTASSTTGRLVSFICSQCGETAIVERDVAERMLHLFCSQDCVRAFDVANRLLSPPVMDDDDGDIFNRPIP